MKIPKNYDVVGKEPPNWDKGTNPMDNPQIEPRSSIPDTPGEKTQNMTSVTEVTKGQPFGKGGSGYTNKD